MLKLQGKLNTTQPFLSGMNGQQVKLYRDKDTQSPVVGVSGQTHQYLLNSGGALYLTQAEVQD